jgi:hypothetical protein
LKSTLRDSLELPKTQSGPPVTRIQTVPAETSDNEGTVLIKSILEFVREQHVDAQETLNVVEKKLLQLHNALGVAGAVVLLTTIQDVDAESLARQFAGWILFELNIKNDDIARLIADLLTELIATRIVCRRLEVHDLSTPILMHIVRECVNEATRRSRQFCGKENRRATPDGYRIRVVLDDFSTWKEIYPEIREEPLFLPALLFYLRRENVAALIVDSHPGRPGATVTDPFDSELRALVDHHLYTWRVQFFGESRIAIAAMPPTVKDEIPDVEISPSPQFVVRELKWRKPGRKRRPAIDPHFELYTGMEEGQPAPVGLDIRLFTEGSEFSSYADDRAPRAQRAEEGPMCVTA